MGSSRHGYRKGHDSPSSFLSTTVSPKISKKKCGDIGHHLLGSCLDSGWGRGWRGARQRREAFGQGHLPTLGRSGTQGAAGASGSFRNSPTSSLAPEELPLRNTNVCLSCVFHFELSWSHRETNAFSSPNGRRFFVTIVIFLVSVFVSSPSSSSLLSKIAKSCILLPSCLL